MIWDLKKEIWLWVALGVLFCSISVFAAPLQVQVTAPRVHGTYSVGIGSGISFKAGKKTHEGVFLGKMVNPDGSVAGAMIADQDYGKAYFVQREDFKGVALASKAEPVLKQYDQIDGTCTGYAIDHYIQQMRWLGFSSKTLDETLSSEKGRAQLLVESINNYYLATQHHYSIVGILNGFGKRFGFECKKKMFKSGQRAIQFVNESLERQVPVMISFNIGPDMVDSTIPVRNYPKVKTEVDSRLWVPRKIGERMAGGHTVVAVSSFEFRGSKKYLMLDSDWDAPRVWDPVDYLDGKTAIEEVEFFTCE